VFYFLSSQVLYALLVSKIQSLVFRFYRFFLLQLLHPQECNYPVVDFRFLRVSMVSGSTAKMTRYIE